MIINLAESQRNSISVSKFSSVNFELGSYTIKDSQIKIRIDHPADSVRVCISFDEPIKLNSFSMDLIGILISDKDDPMKSTFFEAFLSDDLINISEFPVKKYNGAYYSRIDGFDELVYKKSYSEEDLFKNFVLIKASENQREIEELRAFGQYVTEIGSNDSFKEIWTKSIVFVINNINASRSNPFTISNIKIESDIQLDPNISFLSIRTDDMFQQRIFDTEKFFPDISKTFFEQMEGKLNQEAEKFLSVKSSIKRNR